MEQNYEEKFEVRDLREKEWFVVDDKFLNGYAKFLGVYAVGVYCSLCRCANKKQKSWPSIKKIANDLGIGRTKVMESIKFLEFWKIINKQRIGLRCTNRYLLIKKSSWRLVNEDVLKEFSEVCQEDFRSLQRKLRKSMEHTSKVSKHNSKDIKKEGVLFDQNKTKAENYRNGVRTYKPYYMGYMMRWKPSENKWYVIQHGEWLEFADKENKIEWR